MGGVRVRPEEHALRPHRSQAQVPGHHLPARAGPALGRGDSQDLLHRRQHQHRRRQAVVDGVSRTARRGPTCWARSRRTPSCMQGRRDCALRPQDHGAHAEGAARGQHREDRGGAGRAGRRDDGCRHRGHDHRRSDCGSQPGADRRPPAQGAVERRARASRSSSPSATTWATSSPTR